MRIIKFQAWNTIVKRMSDCVTLKEIYETKTVQRHILTWLEFTGLKDKNGVDIYEGDIIKNWGINYLVEYELYDNMQGFSIDSDDSDLEVIGNIYENPELLSTPTAVL